MADEVRRPRRRRIIRRPGRPEPEALAPQASLTPEDRPTLSTGEPGEAVDEGKGRIFPCEGCGADLEFHVGVQSLKCPYCGFTKALNVDENAEVREQDLEAALDRLSEQREGKVQVDDEAREVRCASCGAEVVFRGTLTSTECPYCASPIQREGIHRAGPRLPVDGVLPFRVSRDQATANLRRWIAGLWFAPNEFRRRGAEGKFAGVYTPYWTFDSMTASRYAGERGEHYYVTVGTGKNKRRERRTRWYSASGAFQRFFDDVLVVAGRGLPDKLLDRLEPWPMRRLMPFNPEVLAGYLARTYDVSLKAGFVKAKQRIDAALRSEVRRRIGGDEQRIHWIKTQHSALTYKHLLLPVWMMAYLYGNKRYQLVINACTGEVQGERPWSWLKIAAVVVPALILVIVIVLMSQQG